MSTQLNNIGAYNGRVFILSQVSGPHPMTPVLTYTYDRAESMLKDMIADLVQKDYQEEMKKDGLCRETANILAWAKKRKLVTDYSYLGSECPVVFAINYHIVDTKYILDHERRMEDFTYMDKISTEYHGMRLEMMYTSRRKLNFIEEPCLDAILYIPAKMLSDVNDERIIQAGYHFETDISAYFDWQRSSRPYQVVKDSFGRTLTRIAKKCLKGVYDKAKSPKTKRFVAHTACQFAIMIRQTMEEMQYECNDIRFFTELRRITEGKDNG